MQGQSDFANIVEAESLECTSVCNINGSIYFYTFAEHVAHDSGHVDAEHVAHNSSHIDAEHVAHNS